jgi:hypothetical protein
MANHRAEIDDLWMSGPEIEFLAHTLKVLPVEAMLWDKLYIMQRDRCDWPDVLNLLYAAGREIRWEYVVRRMGADAALLAGILTVYAWVAPGRALELPDWLWPSLGVAPPAAGAAAPIDYAHVRLLDRRPWFGPDRDKLQNAA